MASADKQLLVTETVRALRAKGVKSRISGLSANDLEKPFLRNGANGFLIKPFPCAKEPLTREFFMRMGSKTMASAPKRNLVRGARLVLTGIGVRTHLSSVSF